MITIDGSYGEGGGALIRTALAVSALTQNPVRIEHVRGGTKFPGVDPEDIAILRVLAQSCQAETPGLEVGGNTLSFFPSRRPVGLNEKLEVPEAADGPGHANSLVVLNALVPIMAKTGVYTTFECQGETYGNNVLTYDYFANVTLGALRKMGLYAQCDLLQAGFGRGSRGMVRLEIEPSVVQGVQWGERGEVTAVRAVVVTSDLPDVIGQRGVAHLARLGHHAGVQVDAEVSRVRGRGPGAFVSVWAECERGFGGATAMGARGLRMENIAQTAFSGLQEWLKSEASVDSNLVDQVLVAASFAEGESVLKVQRLTQRFLTMVWVIKQFLPIHITVKGQEGGPGVVSIRR